LINENRQAYFVSQNPFAPDVLREVPKKDVTTTKVSKVSLMMPGLINSLNDEELKDLMAYLMAGGRKEHPVFQTREVQVKKVSN
jgi:cytochrome c1